MVSDSTSLCGEILSTASLLSTNCPPGGCWSYLPRADTRLVGTVGRSGGLVISHLSGALLTVKGGGSINYPGGNQDCPWQVRTWARPAGEVPAISPDPPLASEKHLPFLCFGLGTPALPCVSAGPAGPWLPDWLPCPGRAGGGRGFHAPLVHC